MLTCEIKENITDIFPFLTMMLLRNILDIYTPIVLVQKKAGELCEQLHVKMKKMLRFMPGIEESLDALIGG